MRTENPAATASFNAMNSVACDGLERLSEQRLTKAANQLPDVGARIVGFVHPLDFNARCCPGKLYNVATERPTRDERTGKPDNRLTPEHGYFYGISILHDGDQRHNGIMGEIGVMD
jgi:hypothetical protein